MVSIKEFFGDIADYDDDERNHPENFKSMNVGGADFPYDKGSSALESEVSGVPINFGISDRSELGGAGLMGSPMGWAGSPNKRDVTDYIQDNDKETEYYGKKKPSYGEYELSNESFDSSVPEIEPINKPDDWKDETDYNLEKKLNILYHNHNRDNNDDDQDDQERFVDGPGDLFVITGNQIFNSELGDPDENQSQEIVPKESIWGELVKMIRRENAKKIFSK